MFLYQENNGYWYVYYRDKASGMRRKVTTHSKNKSAANAFYLNFQNTNVLAPKKQIIFVEGLRNDVRRYVLNNLSPKSVSSYESVFKYILKYIGNKPLELIGFKDIENYKTERSKSIKPISVNSDLRTMKSIFNIAIKLDYLIKNPVNKVNKLEVPDKEIMTFNDTEIDMLLETINHDLIKNVTEFALYTSMRLNEIMYMRWQDVDLANKVLIVCNKEGFKTKNRKNRKIPISEKLVVLLNKIQKKDSGSNIINLYDGSGYIFKKDNGEKYNGGYVSHCFKKYVVKAGLNEELHFHSLRHTAITKLIRERVPIKQVQQIAGHLNISTTLEYIHLDCEDLREGINKL